MATTDDIWWGTRFWAWWVPFLDRELGRTACVDADDTAPTPDKSRSGHDDDREIQQDTMAVRR